jgi:tetratricopeptide (TPR) repeat protein
MLAGMVMVTESGDATQMKPVSRLKRRRIFAVVALLLIAGTAAATGWYWWLRPKGPAPPQIPLEGVDPKLAEAIQAACDKVVKKPSSAEAWGHLGKLLYVSNYSEEARVCFARAEELDAGNVRWPYLRGDSLLQLDPEEALPHLRRAVELSDKAKRPETAAPWLRLAEVLLALGKYDEAEGPLRRALEVDPEEARVHWNLGLLAYFRQDLEESRRQLLRCLHDPCTQKKAYIQLAAVAQRLGNLEEAAKFSRRAENLPSDRPWNDPFLLECMQLAVGRPSRFQYAERLETQGNFREAAAVRQELLDECPDYRLYVALGKDLGQLGDVAGAERALRAAIDASPDNVQAYYLLSGLLRFQAEQRWQRENDREKARSLFREAEKCARQAIERKPDHALAHLYLGISLRYLEQRSEAIAALRKAVQCRPELADPHLHLGEMLAEEGQFAEARQQLAEAADLAKPTDNRPGRALERLSALEKKMER